MKRQRASGKWQTASGKWQTVELKVQHDLVLDWGWTRSPSLGRRGTHVARKVFYQFGVL